MSLAPGQTQTKPDTIQTELDSGNPNTIPNCLAQMKLGTMLAALKVVVTGMTAAGTVNLTTMLTALGTATVTVTGIDLTDLTVLPALLALRSLRVTAATTASTAGSYGLTDAGGTAVTANTSAVMGICKISDDGKTITFPTTDVTAFVIEYVGRSAVDMTTNFAST